MNRYNKQTKVNHNKKIRMILREDSFNNSDNIRPRINNPQNKVTLFTNTQKPRGTSSRLFRPKSVKIDMKNSIFAGGTVIIVSYCLTGMITKLKILEAFITTLVSYGVKIKQEFDIDESIALIAIGENLNKNDTITINRIINKIITKSKLFSRRKAYTKEFVMEILERLENRDVVELRGNYLVLKERIILKQKS